MFVKQRRQIEQKDYVKAGLHQARSQHVLENMTERVETQEKRSERCRDVI